MNQPQPDFVVDTADPEQTANVGAAVGRCCQPGDIIALQGELGAGKTQFVRGLARGLGLDARHVSSPTFVMAQEYEPAEDQDLPVLVHIDAYRIHSGDDLASIGWHGHGEEMREQAVVAVEWASLIRPSLGDDLLWVDLQHESLGRRISLSAQGAWRDKLEVLSQSIHDAGFAQIKGAEP